MEIQDRMLVSINTDNRLSPREKVIITDKINRFFAEGR